MKYIFLKKMCKIYLTKNFISKIDFWVVWVKNPLFTKFFSEDLGKSSLEIIVKDDMSILNLHFPACRHTYRLESRA